MSVFSTRRLLAVGCSLFCGAVASYAEVYECHTPQPDARYFHIAMADDVSCSPALVFERQLSEEGHHMTQWMQVPGRTKVRLRFDVGGMDVKAGDLKFYIAPGDGVSMGNGSQFKDATLDVSDQVKPLICKRR